MPLGRQRLLQRFFNLHHCIATTRAKQKRTATPPRKRLSRPIASIANVGEHRQAPTERPPFAKSRSGSSRQTPLQTTPGSPEAAPSPPRALQHAQRCRIEQPSLQMTAFLTTNEGGADNSLDQPKRLVPCLSGTAWGSSSRATASCGARCRSGCTRPAAP